MTPDLALAASAREWPDRLHRHLLDHGGARVVARIMGPEQAVQTEFDLLLIDDVSSFLSPRLVSVIKQSGSEVLGVFAPSDGSDAKRRLLECGIGDVIECDAKPEEFLERVNATLAHRRKPDEEEEEEQPRPNPGWSIGVTGASDGVGITEVAVGLAHEVSSRASAILVDLDPTWPSVAQRLDLPLHPNLRTALDIAVHTSDDVDDAIHQLGDLAVLGGVADQGAASPLSYAELGMLLDEIGDSADLLVADLGPHDRAVHGVLRGFDTLVVVGVGDPVGIARLIRIAEKLVEAVDERSVVVVVNKAPRRRYHISEIRAEIAAVLPGVPTLLLPYDRRLGDSMWEGDANPRGPFARAIRRMARLITDMLD